MIGSVMLVNIGEARITAFVCLVELAVNIVDVVQMGNAPVEIAGWGRSGRGGEREDDHRNMQRRENERAKCSDLCPGKHD